MVFCNEFISMNFSKAQEVPTKKNIKNTIIVTISGIGHEDESEKYILLEDSFLDFNVLGITNKKRDFFINDSTENSLDFLRNFLKDFSKVVIISHSMGGFFAFYISSYIKVDLCIVCSPYLSLSEKEMNLNDSEEFILFDKINKSYIENYCLNNIKVSSLSPKDQDKFIVILDLSIKDDNKTFYLINKFLNKINVVVLPGLGHLSLYCLEKRKILSSVIRNQLNESYSLPTKNILEHILNSYLEFPLSREEKICIKNQIYFNNPDQYGGYYYFVYDYLPNEESSELFIIINKHGYIMSFYSSIAGSFWSEFPFEDNRFSPIIVDSQKKTCFCFYNSSLIEMDYNKISIETNKIDKFYRKIPFSRDFFEIYFNNFKFDDKIEIYSAIDINKKKKKNKFAFVLNKITRFFRR